MDMDEGENTNICLIQNLLEPAGYHAAQQVAHLMGPNMMYLLAPPWCICSIHAAHLFFHINLGYGPNNEANPDVR